MKVWYDACTGKHMRYGIAIARRLRKKGCEVVLTTRRHPDTLGLAQALNEKVIVIGKYAPSSLPTRLAESARRTLGFLELFKNTQPNVAISHQSPELCRTAFGLNIPIILTADTPHALAVNRLTIPLATKLVVSEAIPKHFFQAYGANDIIQFKGVDEVAWTKNSQPSLNFHFRKPLRKPLIVVRQIETRASYAFGEKDATLKVAKKLSKVGTVLFLSRYVKRDIPGLEVVKDFVDSASLVSHADLVISAGGTISREATLQGVPSIVLTSISRTHVNRYLAEKGFPMFFADTSNVLVHAKKHLGKLVDVKKKLEQLQNPLDIIEPLIVNRSFGKELKPLLMEKN
jgi:predicted glycosyltransferase